MSEKQNLENNRDQDLRLTCIDMATRLVGKPVYLMDENQGTLKHHDDIVDVANKIYEFVVNGK